ncbi:MAG TPA: helix-turn-helix domain-containing protein [Solirubrobacteraceae bacterium]|nr:helix-turn-helix domain-containing protein [Solirubrobacteraceae bacterium]
MGPAPRDAGRRAARTCCRAARHRTGHRHEHRRGTSDVRDAVRARRAAARADRRQHPRWTCRRPRPRPQGRAATQAQPEQIALAQQLYDAGERTVQQIADIFNVPRTTVYGHLEQSSKGKRPAVQRAAAGA